jgi:hypothetical protein
MKAFVAIDREAILNIAQQLEARCDPVFMGQELRTLVTGSGRAVPTSLATRLASEVRCRCVRDYELKVAKPCRACVAIAELQTITAPEKPNGG